jgi:hypothetical protein
MLVSGGAERNGSGPARRPWRGAGTEVFETGREGAVTAEMQGKSLAVRTYRAGVEEGTAESAPAGSASPSSFKLP